MKKPRPTRPKAIKERAAQTAAVITPASPVAAEAAPRSRFNPLQFARDVRAEARKITWTSRRETWITSVMVFIMVAITAFFFFFLDKGLSFAMANILKFATPGS